MANESLCVLSRCILIDLVLEMYIEIEDAINKNRNDDSYTDINSRNLYYNLDSFDLSFNILSNNVRVLNYNFFTDVSKINNLVGSAIVIYTTEDIEIDHLNMRSSNTSSVFMAEIHTIKEAVNFCNDHLGNDNVNIITGSLSVLLSICNLKEDRNIFTSIRRNIGKHGNIKLLWTRAHSGTKEDERAHKSAKKQRHSKIFIRAIKNPMPVQKTDKEPIFN